MLLPKTNKYIFGSDPSRLSRCFFLDVRKNPASLFLLAGVLSSVSPSESPSVCLSVSPSVSTYVSPSEFLARPRRESQL